MFVVCRNVQLMLKTKLSIVQEHMRAGRWQDAVKMAARFPRLDGHRDAILSAHMAYTNPRFVAQLKKDAEALKLAGQRALIDRFGLE